MATKLYDLSNPHGPMGPTWPHIVVPNVMVISPFPTLTRVREHNMALYGGQTRRVCVGSMGHQGTHCDSPNHEKEGGMSAAQIPIEQCYGTGVIVDMRYMKKWDKIDAEAFEKAEPKIKEGDIVICNTGWHHYWWKNAYVYHNHYPGLVPSGTEWLVKKKVKAWGGTVGSLDHPLAYYPIDQYYPWRVEEYMKETGKHPHEEFPTYEPCHHMLCINDIVAIENVGGDIDKVTGIRCTIAAFFARMEGTQGHQTRLVAIVEE